MSYVAGVLAPGTRVAGYKVEALIGRGGMGAVYRAEEEGLGRKVALKVIAPELAQDDRFRERFLRESRIAASLDHPHVIPIYQAGDEDGLLFLAMRYVEGTDLARVVAEDGALETRRAVDLLSQVAEALDAAHEKGLVHRDVKPSNVLIAEAAGREHCYLGDFGLTKRTGSLSGVSVAGEIVGTLEYVAPEQITGNPLDERSDVYSLGCVLYECLTGQSPFPRATDVALLWAHVHEEPTPPSKAKPELPKELDTVLTRALAKEPGRRYRSAGELVAATRSALRLGDAPAAPRGRSRMGIALAAAVALLALAALAAFLLTRGSSGLTAVAPNHVGVIDPATSALVDEIQVGRDPLAVTTGGGIAWVTSTEEDIVSRIDASDLTATSGITAVPEFPSDVLWHSSSAWVALGPSAGLVRVNPEQTRSSEELSALGDDDPCSSGPYASLAVADGDIWLLCRGGDLGRFDPGTSTGRSVAVEAGLIGTSSASLPVFEDIASGLGSLWIVDAGANSLIELDPVLTRLERPYTVGDDPRAVAVAADSVWVANHGDDTVTRLVFPSQGATPDIVEIDVDDGPVDIAVGAGGVWVVNQLAGTISRIDPETNEVVETITVGNEPQRVAAGEGRVWVTVRAPEDEELESGTTTP